MSHTIPCPYCSAAMETRELHRTPSQPDDDVVMVIETLCINPACPYRTKHSGHGAVVYHDTTARPTTSVVAWELDCQRTRDAHRAAIRSENLRSAIEEFHTHAYPQV